MVRLVVTDHLNRSLDNLGNIKHDGAQLPLELLEAIQAHLDLKQAWVDHKLLARISHWNKSTSAPKVHYTLRELVRGTEVYVEPPAIHQRSPELEAILAPIRLAQEQADYASLLAGPSLNHSRAKDTFDLRNSTDHWDFKTASHPQLSVKQEWDAVKRELSAVANVLASMAAVATAVWWAAGNIDVSTKTLLSLFGALAIAAIEGFLYIRFFQKTRELPVKKPTASRTINHTMPNRLQAKS